MSKQVDLDALSGQLERFGFAYLMTVGDSGRVHAVAVNPSMSDSGLVITEPSHRTHANAAARPNVSLVWPPSAPGGYSLIVDGDAGLDGDILRVTPTRAVLHRPAAPGDTPAETDVPEEQSACRSDCVEI